MYTPDFTKEHYLLLKRFYYNPQIPYSSLENPELLDVLTKNNFVSSINQKYSYSDQISQDKLIYSITFTGSAYFEAQRLSTFRFYLPIILSSILSVISVVLSLVAICR